MLSRRFAKSAYILPLAACLIVSLISSGCGPTSVQQIQTQKNAKQLSAAEVLQLAEGNTLYLHAFQSNAYYYFAPTGALFAQDIDSNRDSGKWDVSDTGELCMKLQWWGYGDLQCFPVYADGQKYYLANNAGVLAFSVDQLAGDPKKLYRETKKAGRSSFRRALREQQPAGETSADAPQPTAEPTPAKPLVSQEIDRPIPPATPGELTATVKWMARDCPGCNLAGSNLNKADLVGAKLQGADLSGANLSMANLRRADLQGANLTGADLSLANLPGADLRDSNLRNASFKGANLIRADLTGAQLDGADFTDALLEGALGISR